MSANIDGMISAWFSGKLKKSLKTCPSPNTWKMTLISSMVKTLKIYKNKVLIK